MIVTTTDRTMVLHLWTKRSHTTATVWTRNARPGPPGRWQMATVHVPLGPGEPITAVLRAVADQLETPVLSRYQPRP